MSLSFLCVANWCNNYRSVPSSGVVANRRCPRVSLLSTLFRPMSLVSNSNPRFIQGFELYTPNFFYFAPFHLIFGSDGLQGRFWAWLMLDRHIFNIYRLLVAISLDSQYLILQHFLHKNQFFPKYESLILARVFRVLVVWTYVRMRSFCT